MPSPVYEFLPNGGAIILAMSSLSNIAASQKYVGKHEDGFHATAGLRKATLIALEWSGLCSH